VLKKLMSGKRSAGQLRRQTQCWRHMGLIS